MALGKIGGGYGSLVSMGSRVVSRCPWLPNFGAWLPKPLLPEVTLGFSCYDYETATVKRMGIKNQNKRRHHSK